MAKISKLDALTIFDSRGNPTVKAWILLDDGTVATSAVPSGASKGTYEAVELRDKEEAYNGMGVTKAIENIKNTIAPALTGMEITDIQSIDKKMIELDGTDNKSVLGANATLAVSQTAVKAGAMSTNTPLYAYIRNMLASPTSDFQLPTPLFNMIEGGQHADNGLNFQEYLIIPATKKTFEEKMELGVHVYQELKKELADKNMSTLVADEGGFAPDLSTNADALLLIKSAVEKAHYKFALDVFLGIDIASNSFRDTKNYKLLERNTSYSPQELCEYYKTLAADYSLLYLEDPFSEEDIASWKTLHESLSTNTLVVGDDLTVTNPYRLQVALDQNAIGGIIIKPNQIGTITEAIAVSEMARFKNIKVIVSHRSGETTDEFVADFAVGIGAEYAKFGSPAHERIAKYNRLLEISYELATSIYTPTASETVTE
ncbi:MAG TPA: phosphopyruvate hydratase [Candidatus Levybacteria bacterium]|nr:phosphopyruvate hydratase [Candidatus Levybacteria bacterium]